MTITEPTALTLDEKAALTSGENFWWTKGADGIAAVRVSDGPHGLRWTDTEAPSAVARSAPSTCFPPAAGLAQSWDPALAERVGVALGRECRMRNVDVLLGPGINIKRSPLGGRNFEYYSEDPLLTAAMATGWVRGLQSQGVGASLKHFAANNAEHDRMRASSDIDPRALREIYLRAFQQVIADAAPWTVMCSYNRLNGELVSQNHFLLTQVLREEWGYDGLVVSDWGAVADRAAAVAAGCDLAMPSPGAASDAELAAAVRTGAVPEDVLDRAVARLADLSRKAAGGRGSWAAREPGPGHDVDAHHALAWEAATRSIALLKNDAVGDRGPVLPLSASESLAVIGVFAETPRYQGGGSSHVTPTRVDSPLEALTAAAGAVMYAPGFTVDGSGPDEALVAEAVAAARAADAAVLFLGLAARQESEGFDRTTIELAGRAGPARRGGRGGQPAHGRGAVPRRRAAPRPAGRARARHPRRGAAGAGGRQRARGRAARRGQPLGAASRDGPGAHRGHRRVPQLPRRALARAVRGGHIRRVPLARRPGPAGRVRVRAWPVLHLVRLLRPVPGRRR